MSKHNLTEETLVAFVVANQERLYRLAYSHVQNREDAMDVVQQSICKALSAHTSLSQPETLRSWFFRILINTAYDLLRKNRRFQPVDDQTLARYEPVQEDNHVDFDLEQALAAMDPRYRSVIVLRFFEDLKIDEVAEVLQENVNTVKARLYKALSMLRLQMNDPALGEETCTWKDR